MTYPRFSHPTRHIDRIHARSDVEIDDTHVIIHYGIGKDAQVRFVGPKTVATIGEGVARRAKVTIESPHALVAVTGSLRADSSFTMRDGELKIYGGIHRRAELITDGEYSVGRKISSLAKIIIANSVEASEDPAIISQLAAYQNQNAGVDNPEVPSILQSFFAPGGPGSIPDSVLERFLNT